MRVNPFMILRTNFTSFDLESENLSKVGILAVNIVNTVWAQYIKIFFPHVGAAQQSGNTTITYSIIIF